MTESVVAAGTRINTRNDILGCLIAPYGVGYPVAVTDGLTNYGQEVKNG